MDREQAQFFGGRSVATAGVAGVVVAPELRGTGLGRAVLAALLHGARQRGAVLSSLFRTTPGPYRSLGYEEVGAQRWTALPTAALSNLRVPAAMTLRAATTDDAPAMRTIRHEISRTGAGAMDYRSPVYDVDPAAELADVDGTTLAIDTDGAVQGFSTWDRGPGYDAKAVLTVDELRALTPDATTALLANLSTWGQVTPTLHLRLPEPDPSRLIGAFTGASVLSEEPWMLRLLDAPGAIAARGWPPYLHAEVTVELVDEQVPDNAETWSLKLSGGAGSLERTTGSAPRFSARGAAAWYAGIHPSILRRAGLLTGPFDSDELLAAATAGPPTSLIDYF